MRANSLCMYFKRIKEEPGIKESFSKVGREDEARVNSGGNHKLTTFSFELSNESEIVVPRSKT